MPKSMIMSTLVGSTQPWAETPHAHPVNGGNRLVVTVTDIPDDRTADQIATVLGRCAIYSTTGGTVRYADLVPGAILHSIDGGDMLAPHRSDAPAPLIVPHATQDKQLWTVHVPAGSDYSISGTTLTQAVEDNFSLIARKAAIGNAAGWKLHSVMGRYSRDILGGHGGVELTIVHTGLDLAHKKADADPVKTTVWIYSDDQSYAHDFEITRN